MVPVSTLMYSATHTRDDAPPSALRYRGAGWVAVPSVAPGAPASATAPGDPGTMMFNAGYLYVCVAADSWMRAPLETW